MSEKKSKKLSGAQNKKRRLQREEIEHKLAGSLTEEVANQLDMDPVFPVIRKRKKTKMFEYEATDEPINDAKQYFKINFFFAILDTTIQSITERFVQLKEHNEDFKLIHDISKLKEWNDDDLLKHCKDMHMKLSDNQNFKDRDIDGMALYEELKTLQCFVKPEMSPHGVLNYMYENKLSETFPNVAIVLRIYLTLPVSVASGERSFSKLKIIKNYLRSTMCDERLTDLSVISIENDILDDINISDLIKNFVAAKARRINI